MGRSGGGGHSGGFSGGGRSSGSFGGGFSGGGRSSRSSGSGFSGGGRSSRSFGSGFPGAGRSSRGFVSGFPGGFSGGTGRKIAGRGGIGCGMAFLVLLVFIVILAIFFGRLGGGVSSNIQPSTYEREKLSADQVQETAYYTDSDGTWINNRSQLESGLKSFYRETGVQPYLYILPNGTSTSTSELTTFAEQSYEQLFQDEGHFLLVFCDDGNGSYKCGYTVGNAAKTVVDDEAISILSDYLDRYYGDYSISEEEIFSNAFEKTGVRIMTVTKSPLGIIAVCVAVIVVAFTVFILLKKRAERKKKEQEDMEKILNAPLEKFGETDLDALEKKYQEDGQNESETSSQD